MNQLNFIIEQG